MNLSEQLGAIFGTTTSAAPAPAPSAEDLQKQAGVEFFEKICSENGVDVSQLTDAQLTELYDATEALRKEAAAAEAATSAAPAAPAAQAPSQDNTKIASAQQEYQQKVAAYRDAQTADMMGRIMAHSYVNEMQKISSNLVPGGEKKDDKDGKDGKEKEKEKESAAQKVASILSQLQTGATGSTTENLDQIAAYRAIDMLKQAGYAADASFTAVDSVYRQGLADSTKIASAGSFDRAVHLRALEFCEAAGAKIDWNKA